MSLLRLVQFGSGVALGRGLGVYWADHDVREAMVCFAVALVLAVWSIDPGRGSAR